MPILYQNVGCARFLLRCMVKYWYWTLYFNSGLSVKISNKDACKYAHLGERVEFCCEATGTDPLQYKWSGPGLTTEDRNNKTLIIPTVTRKHEGEYKCSVENNFQNTPTVLECALFIGKLALYLLALSNWDNYFWGEPERPPHRRDLLHCAACVYLFACLQPYTINFKRANLFLNILWTLNYCQIAASTTHRWVEGWSMHGNLLLCCYWLSTAGCSQAVEIWMVMPLVERVTSGKGHTCILKRHS